MSTKTAFLFALLFSTMGFRVSTLQNPPPKQQTPPPARTETFWHRVLRVSGIAASPSTLKGPGDEIQQGQLWITEVRTDKTRQLAAGSYRSPVFESGSLTLLALRGSNVTRISVSDGSSTPLFPVTGILKLVGFSIDDVNALLILFRDTSGQLSVAFLDVRTGKLTPLPYDPSSNSDRHMVEHLSAWTRSYGDASLYVDQQTKEGIAGTLSWMDVFFKKGNQPPVNISHCDGTNCGQPSLSSDGRFVAFVRSDEN